MENNALKYIEKLILKTIQKYQTLMVNRLKVLHICLNRKHSTAVTAVINVISHPI